MMKKTSKNLFFILIGLVFNCSSLVPTAFSADATYYNTATNNPGVWRISKIEYDHDNDGVIDDTENHTYNVEGNYIRYDQSFSDNHISYYTYNVIGQKVKKETDHEVDGIIDEVINYIYDNNGNIVESYTENEWFGSHKYKTYYECDNYGNYREITVYSISNESQMLNRRTKYYYDINNYSYDANNQPIKIEIDYTGDGIINNVRSIIYDKNGNILEDKEVSDHYVSVSTHVYNSEGDMIFYTYQSGYSGFISYDTSPQKYLDEKIVMVLLNKDPWDKWELLPQKFRWSSKTEIDTNGDGLINEISYTKFDPYGLVDRYETDENNDGIIDSVHYFTWIKDGNAEPAPNPPVAITVPETNSTGSYSVSWGSSSTQDVTYVLEEATNAGFSSGLRQVYKGNATYANIVGRTIGVTYYYRVKAIKNGYLDSDWKTTSNGCLVIEPPVLSVLPSVTTVSKNSGTDTFRVSSTGIGTMAWTAAVLSGNDWLTISDGAGGTGDGIFTCQFEVNTGTSSRSSIIRITADNATGSPTDVTLTQLAIIPFDIQDAFDAMKIISGQESGINEGSDISGDGKIGLPEAIYPLQALSDLRNPDTVMAPEILSVPEKSATGNFTVSWSVSSIDGAMTYLLEEANNQSFTSGLRIVYSGLETHADITGRTDGKTYFYRVKATKKGFLDSNWRIGSNECNIVTPSHDQYTVTFQDHDGTELKVEAVLYGSGATAPEEPTRKGYTFTGWDKAFTNVTGNLIVKALYEYQPVMNIGRVLWMRDVDASAFPDDVKEKLTSWQNSEQAFGDRMAYRIKDMKANPDSFTPDYTDLYDTFLQYTDTLTPHQAYSMGYTLGMEISRGYQEVPATYDFSFPADDAPQWNYQNGWHFFVGTVVAETGQEYGVQFMLWQNAHLPPDIASDTGLTEIENQIVEMHLAITPAGDRHYRSKPYVIAGTTGLVGFNASPFKYSQGNNQILSLQEGQLFPLQLKAWGIDNTQGDEVELEIDITLEQAKPYMLNGNGKDGFDPSCGGVGTLYYSISNCPVTPLISTLSINGNKVKLTGGKLWYDHQWGSSPGAVNPRSEVLRALNNLEEQGPDGWEWIAVMFDDDTELALSSLKDLGNKDFYYQTGPLPPGDMTEPAKGRYNDESGNVSQITASLKITEWVKSTVSHDEYMATNTWYPNRIEVTVEDGNVPEEKKLFTLVPIVSTGQSGWFATGWQYSEGAVYVEAPDGTLLGRGFLESTDWADWKPQVLAIMGLPETEENLAIIDKRQPSAELVLKSQTYLEVPENQMELITIMSGCKGL